VKVTYGVYGWEKLKTMIEITTSGNPNSILKKDFQTIIYAFFCGKKWVCELPVQLKKRSFFTYTFFGLYSFCVSI
jgi:hypothetical protein